jgi:hypothetical protein
VNRKIVRSVRREVILLLLSEVLLRDRIYHRFYGF